MKERNGLDNNILRTWYNLYSNDNDDDSKEPKSKKKIRQKVIKFNENASKCENFTMKKGEVRSRIYWCKYIDKSCTFHNCPKNKKQNVND